jgi:S1-C subfamily serine protease
MHIKFPWLPLLSMLVISLSIQVECRAQQNTENVSNERAVLNAMLDQISLGVEGIGESVVLRSYASKGWYGVKGISEEEYPKFLEVIKDKLGAGRNPLPDFYQWNAGRGISILLMPKSQAVTPSQYAYLEPSFGALDDFMAASAQHIKSPGVLIIVNRITDNKYVMSERPVERRQVPAREMLPSRQQPAQIADMPQGTSTGTSFMVSQEYMMTSYHVVKGKPNIGIYVNGKEYTATVAGVNERSDLALLKVPGLRGTPLSVGNISGVKLGEEVFTLGFPNMEIQGIKPKYTKGDVSSLTGIKDDPTLMQISVPIQPGNSGGPLFNSKGQVIGVIAATLNNASTLKNTGALPQNVNYAVRVDKIGAFLSANKITTATTSSSKSPDELTQGIGLVFAR